VIPGKQYMPEDVLRIAWRRKWVILLPAIAIATSVSVWTYRLEDQYRSEALIQVVPQRVPENYVRSNVTIPIESRLDTISQQIQGRSRLEKIVRELNLYAEYRQTMLMEDIIDWMRASIDVQFARGDAFTVGFTSNDPRTCMRVVERLASLYIDENQRDREVLTNDTTQFLESQVADARRQLIENEKKVQEYRQRHNGELPTQVDANLAAMHDIQLQLQSLSESLNRDRDRRLVLERIIADASLPNAAQAQAARNQGAEEQASAGGAADQLAAAEEELQTLLLRLKPEHPDVIRLNRTIVGLRKRADAEAANLPLGPDINPAEAMRRNRLNESKAEIANLDQQIAEKLAEEKRLHGAIGDYQKRLEATPSRESELTDLMRDYETTQQTYRDLLSKKQDSRISANLERRQIGEQFKLLDPPRVPEKPVSPNRPRFYMLGIFAALGVGLGLAAALEYFDRAMRSEDDVKAALNLLVIATIPVMTGAQTAKLRRTGLAAWLTLGAAVIVGAAAIAWRLLK